MSGGIGQSHSEGSTEDRYGDCRNQPKSRSGPEFLGLSRCAACYNQQASSMPWHGGDGESSSSAEDSGPEVDWESEAESSSGSSFSGKALSEILEKPSPVSGDAAGPEKIQDGGKDGHGREETGETSESQEDESRTKGMTRRAPLVKSFSLPTSLTPHLTPLSLLPRPHTVVSTLHLQVLPHNDTFYIAKQHLSEREEEKTEESNGGEREGINNWLPPQPFQLQQTGLPWQQPTVQHHQLSYQYQQQPPPQHQLSHQYQQQQPQHFPPHSAQGQRLPPPPHTLPVLHPPTLHTPLQAPSAPLTHLHALTPQPCWYCYSMYFPYSPYWSLYSSGQFPR